LHKRVAKDRRETRKREVRKKSGLIGSNYPMAASQGVGSGGRAIVLLV
jgi:hypothetical protein